MARLSLKSIRRENARLVLEAIARKKHITKLEISEETGLSLMTAGKIVSVLGAGGIIMRGKSTEQKAGRRAEVFRIRHDWLIPVFEIASRIFKFYITDLEGNVLDKIEYRCTDSPMYVSNEFVSFLKKAVELLKGHYKNKHALGIGVSVAGIYDAENDKIISSMMPELSSLKLMNNISKIFKQSNVVIDNANRLCAAGLIESDKNYRERSFACLSVGDSIECTTCDAGTYICGANNLAGRLGDIPYAPGLTYANFMRDARYADDVFSPILDLLKFIAVAYDPDKIYLCSDKFVFSPPLKDRLYSSLCTEMRWANDRRPELSVINSGTLESLNAIISRVIENWLDSLLDGEE